jgi:sulfonate transport system substrate-binding protein
MRLLPVLALILTFHAARADPPLSLRIAYLKSTTDLTLAKAHGSLERALATQNVTVEWAGPFPASAPAVEALNAGAADLTGGSSTSFITSRAGGVKLVMFAYQPQSAANEGIIVLANSPLRSLSDLAGHSVAVNRGGTGEYLLVRALTRAGIPLDRVRRDYLSPPDASAAFNGGHVDAWAIWDPYVSVTLLNGHARFLADGAQVGSENAIAFFARQEFLAAHRPVIAAVFAVLQAENTWSRAHKLEAGDIWARELGMPAEVAPRLGEFDTNVIGTVGTAEAEHIGHIADWYVENGIVPVRPDIASFVTDISK